MKLWLFTDNEMNSINYLKDLTAKIYYENLKSEVMVFENNSGILIQADLKNWIYILTGKKGEYHYNCKIKNREGGGKFLLKESAKIQEIINKIKENKPGLFDGLIGWIFGDK